MESQPGVFRAAYAVQSGQLVTVVIVRSYSAYRIPINNLSFPQHQSRPN